MLKVASVTSVVMLWMKRRNKEKAKKSQKIELKGLEKESKVTDDAVKHVDEMTRTKKEVMEV